MPYRPALHVLLWLAILLLPIGAQAQTFAEWFSQKKTQKKYLLEQLEALQVYSGYLKQGYQIANGGLGSISGYLRDEYDLHSIYYGKLRQASPEIRNNYQVREIVTRQKEIVSRFGSLDDIAGLSTAQRSYLSKVRSAVLADCDRQLELLQTVLTDNRVEMQDADRLKLISRIHTAIVGNFQFTVRFVAQTTALASQRIREKSQVEVEKRLYGIN